MSARPAISGAAISRWRNMSPASRAERDGVSGTRQRTVLRDVDAELPISRLAFCAARLAGGVRSVRRNLCALRRDGAAQESLGQGVNNPQQIANRCVSEVKQNPRQ
jgi:hypothetical protein